VLDRTEPHPVGKSLAERIPACKPGPGFTSCTPPPPPYFLTFKPLTHLKGHTVIYAPNNIVWVERLMRQVALLNNLDFDSHFSTISPPQNSNLTLDGLKADNATLYNYMINNPNMTQHAIIFPLRTALLLSFFESTFGLLSLSLSLCMCSLSPSGNELNGCAIVAAVCPLLQLYQSNQFGGRNVNGTVQWLV